MLTAGDVLPFATTVKDAAGVLANAGTMTLAIVLPDGTAAPGSPFTITPTSTGLYDKDLTSTLPGRYVGYWLATGVNSGGQPQTFTVRPSADTAIVSLKDVKDGTNITSTTSDEELELYVASATRVAEHFVGPVVIRSYTQHLFADRPRLSYLPARGPGLVPVLTLTSLTPFYASGTSWAVGNLITNPVTGELRQASGTCLYGGPWTVVYTAGQQVVDANWQLAALIIIEHLWQTQRGASGLPLQGGADETFVPGLGFAIPNRAMDLLRLDQQVGIA